MIHKQARQSLPLLALVVFLSIHCLSFAATEYEQGWDHFKAGNYAIAKKIWLPLAEQGDADAALGLAIIFEHGLETERDPRQSTRWYELAASKGIAEAQHDLGIKYFTGSGVSKNYQRTFELWKQASETGLGSAQTKLAYLYLQGLGTNKNEPEALRWYRQAAKQGSTEGMYNLSLMYKRGTGTAVNTHQYLYWLKQAAEQDYAPAQYDLGLMKLHGKDMERSVSEGKQWLVRSAKNGSVDAQYYLGTLLMNGHILRSDKALATELLTAAARQGHAGAKQALIDIQQINSTPSQRKQTARQSSPGVGTTKHTPDTVPAGKQRGNDNTVVLNEKLVKKKRPRQQPPVTSTTGKNTSWLFQQDPASYTIQLLASKDKSSINRFLKRLPGTIETFNYHYTVKGNDWTAVATGIYASHEAATRAAGELPASLRKNKPWVRNMGLIQKMAAK